jgi:hypothetical protein
MAPSKEGKKAATEKGNNARDVEGELNEWKFRVPYKIHEGSTLYMKQVAIAGELRIN